MARRSYRSNVTAGLLLGVFVCVSAPGCGDSDDLESSQSEGGEGGRAGRAPTDAGAAGSGAAGSGAAGSGAADTGAAGAGGATTRPPTNGGGVSGHGALERSGGNGGVKARGDAGAFGAVSKDPLTSAFGGAAGAEAEGPTTDPVAGAAGAPPVAQVASALGAECDTDQDCGGGAFYCLSDKEDFHAGEVGSFPHGVCTADCSDGSDCTVFDPLGICFEPGLCVQGCSFDSAPEDKCHDREDASCQLLKLENESTACGPGGRSCGKGEVCYKSHCHLPRCWAQCTADRDCPDGRFCDVRYGTCESSPPPPSDFGEDCWDGHRCRAVCLSVANGQNEIVSAFCTEPCVAGSTCAEEQGACLFQSYSAGDYVFGNSGYCAQFCDCDDDCKAQGMACQPIDPSWERPGICDVPIDEYGDRLPTIPCGSESTGG